ncbi:MAG TPA: TolC family protein, partial [Caulifigura sp.]|nr:TolC family protein [Caulifigura sp.]
FNPRYLVRTPDSIVAGIAGDLLVPVINRSAIEADYRSANAMQLQEIYDYQRTLLNAFTEVVNSLSKVQNYSDSIAIKKEQLTSLEASVDNASRLFQNARAEYIEVLFAQRDLMEARLAILDTKKEQLVAIVDAYQALGGGLFQHSNYVETVLPTEPPGEPANDQAVPPLVPPQPPAAPEVPMPTPAAPAQDNPAPAPAPAMDE